MAHLDGNLFLFFKLSQKGCCVDANGWKHDFNTFLRCLAEKRSSPHLLNILPLIKSKSQLNRQILCKGH